MARAGDKSESLTPKHSQNGPSLMTKPHSFINVSPGFLIPYSNYHPGTSSILWQNACWTSLTTSDYDMPRAWLNPKENQCVNLFSGSSTHSPPPHTHTHFSLRNITLLIRLLGRIKSLVCSDKIYLGSFRRWGNKTTRRWGLESTPSMGLENWKEN